MRIGQLLFDPAPLRDSRDFRLMFAGRTISLLGAGFTSVALNVQVFDLTRSSFDVGLASLALGVPTMAGLLAGGVLADRADRRLISVIQRFVLAAVVAGLAVNAALPHPALPLIFALAVAHGTANGLGAPALMASVPTLVRREQLTAASALTGAASQLGQVVGPALGGVAAEGAGLSACYWIDAATYLLMAALLCFLRPIPPTTRARRTALRDFAAGFGYLRRQPVLGGLLLIDSVAMVFGMPNALFPVLAATRFHGGAETVGLLYAAPAFGALASAVTSGWISRTTRAGAVLVTAVLVWGAAITGFGLCAFLPAALVLLAIAGAGDIVSETLRRALLQHHTPDEMQGRVSSLWLAQATVGPSVGNAEAGLVARAVSPAFSVVSGGVVAILGAVAVVAAVPALRHSSLPAPAGDESVPVS